MYSKFLSLRKKIGHKGNYTKVFITKSEILCMLNSSLQDVYLMRGWSIRILDVS